jgi:hypothetical protein
MYVIASVMSEQHTVWVKKTVVLPVVGSKRLTYYSFKAKFFLPETLHNRLDLEMA